MDQPRILGAKPTDRIYRAGTHLRVVRQRKQHRDRGHCGWFSAPVGEDEGGLFVALFRHWIEYKQYADLRRQAVHWEQVQGGPLPPLKWATYRGVLVGFGLQPLEILGSDRAKPTSTLQKARELVALLKAIPFSSDREKVLDVIKEEICFKCADIGCDGWCDYESDPGD